MGRLSNPPEAVTAVADQGRSKPGRTSCASQATPSPAETPRHAGPLDEKGRLSNPVQRRLPQVEIKQVIQQDRAGDSIKTLAGRFEVHRTTVMTHLTQTGIVRRRVVRKMTDQSVAVAAAHYPTGASLAVVASAFGVHERTLAREFRQAGVSVRPRRGWQP